MEEPLQSLPHFLEIQPLLTPHLFSLIAVGLLLICSGIISGSEVAFFSLTAEDKKLLKKNTLSKKLLEQPEQLLSTILVANNFVNIGIIILSTYLIDSLFIIPSALLDFLVKVVGISFLILLIGEIIPKTYAIRYPKNLITLTSPIYTVLNYVFFPINYAFLKSSRHFKKRLEKKGNDLTIGDISEVIEMTTNDLDKNEKQLLEGIVNFQNTEVKSVMKSRVNMVAIDISSSFAQVLELVNECGFSRIPVIEQSPDKVLGILYIKDLLPYLGTKNFKWQTIVRSVYFIPESKKIDSLLRDFQLKKTHIAIVIDEYGGTSGLVTLEDILEEIIGDIQDEHDEQEKEMYKKESPSAFLFEAEISLSEFLKIIDKDKKFLDHVKGDADSLGGLVLETIGELPKKDETISIENLKLQIVDVDSRRIKTIRTLLDA